MTSSFSYPEEVYVLIGEVLKAQGLRGELKIHCFSGQPENLRHYPRLALTGKKETAPVVFPLRGVRVLGNSAIIRLKDVDDRDQAEAWIGCGVLVAREDLPDLENGEFYWQDVIGRPVFCRDGRNIGTVCRFFSNGAQDILVVADGEEEHLIPVVEDIVIAIRKDALVIDPPQGLLEINSPIDE